MDLSPLAIGQILYISCVLRKEGAFLSTLLLSFFLCPCYFPIKSLLKTDKLRTVSFLCGQGSGKWCRDSDPDHFFHAGIGKEQKVSVRVHGNPAGERIETAVPSRKDGEIKRQ